MMKSSDDGGHFGAIFGQFFMDFRRKTLGNWGRGSTTHRLGFFRRCQDFRKFLRVVEDDTKTADAVPYWKIDDLGGVEVPELAAGLAGRPGS